MSETVVNTYSGSPLNRLSWLRSSHAVLNRIAALPNARWILFNVGQPLSVTASDGSQSFFLSTSEVKAFIGPAPYWGQGENPGDYIGEESSGNEHSGHHSPLDACRHRGARIVFLGLHEDEKSESSALPLAEFKDPDVAIKTLKGIPYFSLDVADLGLPDDEIRATLESALSNSGKQFAWAEPRSLTATLDWFAAAVFASARSLIDWNYRNKFCPGCGSPTYSMWGGWKISCTSLLPWTKNEGRPACPSAKGLHNYTHPRTDAVVIMIAIDETGNKVLLGRGRRFPGKFYSALAGFIEPGESFEDAVKREMWEEAGVRVWDVRYHSGQPWPYPANLMVGFYARADSSKPIRVDLDNELVDARWYTKQEVRAVLNHRAGTNFRKADYQKLNEIVDGKDNTGASSTAAARAFTPSEDGKTVEKEKQPESVDDTEPPFKVPPATAIAGVLIRDWVEGKIGFSNVPAPNL